MVNAIGLTHSVVNSLQLGSFRNLSQKFRDQLKRYGDTDNIWEVWISSKEVFGDIIFTCCKVTKF